MTSAAGARSRRAALLTVAALTWLNPHLYVDIMMLGTVAYGHSSVGRWWFYAGLIGASVTWFAGLGYAAGRPSRWFTRPRAWRLLGAGVAVAMVSLGTGLILTA